MTEYDDQFEGTFYRSVSEDSQIICLSDFSEKVETDGAHIFKCTTHVESMRYDLKMDSEDKGCNIRRSRILWRNEFVSKITKVLFKQFVQMSENQTIILNWNLVKASST